MLFYILILSLFKTFSPTVFLGLCDVCDSQIFIKNLRITLFMLRLRCNDKATGDDTVKGLNTNVHSTSWLKTRQSYETF